MIRDRGVIKWSSLMLPEHVKMLRDWAKEDENEDRQFLDEQKLEIMNELVVEAMEAEKQVVFTYYVHNRYEQLIGTIHSYSGLERKFRIIDQEGNEKRIPIQDIREMTVTED